MVHPGPKSWQSLYFVLASLLRCAATQSSSASFLYPESSSSVLTINAYDLLNVKWVSNYDQAYLYFWCDVNTGRGVQAYWLHMHSWEVNTTGDATFSPQRELNTTGGGWSSAWACRFDIQYRNHGDDGQQGPIFTIVPDIDSAPTVYDQSFTSLLAPTTSTMATASLPSSSAITSSPESSVPMIYGQSSTSLIAFTTRLTTTSMSVSSSTSWSPVSSVITEGDNKTLSGGAITGVALGAAFAVVALVTVGWCFCRYHRRIKALETRISEAGGPTGHPSQRSIPILPAAKRDTSQAELSELVA